MIPQHASFIAAIADRRKVAVRFFSRADNGVLGRVCAPMNFGPGEACPGGLDRYWFWNYANATGIYKLGLLPPQILELSVLNENFTALDFAHEPATLTPPRNYESKSI